MGRDGVVRAGGEGVGSGFEVQYNKKVERDLPLLPTHVPYLSTSPEKTSQGPEWERLNRAEGKGARMCLCGKGCGGVGWNGGSGEIGV